MRTQNWPNNIIKDLRKKGWDDFGVSKHTKGGPAVNITGKLITISRNKKINKLTKVPEK